MDMMCRAISRTAVIRTGILAVWMVAGAATAADDIRGAYGPAAAAVLSNHDALARRWYEALTASAPAPAPVVVRLGFPRCFGPTSLRLEQVRAAGLPAEAQAWETTRWAFSQTADCAKLVVTGTPEAGTIGGEIRMPLPDDFSGTTNELRLEVRGTVAGGRIQGTFRAFVMAAETPGTLEGSVLTCAAAAKAAPVRALPALDTGALPASSAYAIARLAEGDACALYRCFRALAAVRGDPGLFRESFRTNPIPVPLRAAFGSAGLRARPAAGVTPLTVRGVPGGAKKPPTAAKGPDLDAVGDMGLGEAPEAPAAAAAPAPSEDPAILKARLPSLRSMGDYTGRLRAAVEAHLAATAPAPVERGLAFDDPLFGPWYGTGSLASWTGTVNRLPADAGAQGVQDWPFVHAWQSLGPFEYGPVNWDPVRLPDCAPVRDAEFAGKVGPVWWKRAPTTPSGCTLFTDLDSYAAAAEEEEQPAAPPPKRARRRTATYYGATVIESERDTQVLLAAGCTGYIAVWHDGTLVARGPATEGPEDITRETLLFRANLRRGANHFLVRCDAEAYGLFSHRRPGTATYFWMRACVRGAPGDPAAGAARMEQVAKRKKDLPNLPAGVRGFRHDQTGFFAEADPVTAWDIDRGINVRWIAPIERWSKASPLVVGDPPAQSRVFVCADPHVLVCLDALNGKVLWRRSANVLELTAPDAFRESERLHREYLDARAALEPKLAELGPDYAARLRALAASGKELPRAVAELRGMEGEAERKYAAFLGHLASHGKLTAPAWDGHYSGRWLGYSFATPVTDGRRVFVKFHTGVTAAFDLDGNRLWMVHTPFELGGTTVCMSPVLADDKVIVPAARDPATADSLLLLTALDAASGRTVWTAKADSRKQTASPVVMRLTDGKQDMTVVATDGGTVVRADDGRTLVTSLRGSSSSGTPTPVGDVLYRIELSQGGAVQFVMLDRDHVGARWLWHAGGLYNAIYAGVGHHDGILFGTTHGGSQYMNARGLDLISAATGQPIERPFNLPDKANRKGIFLVPRFGFIPPVASPRAIFIAMRGPGHASSLAEELPDKWTPYTYVTVARHGGLGRFIAHNKVVAPLTPHLALAGDRVYVRNDFELTCFGYTGDEGRAYEAEVNALTLLDDIAPTPPADPAEAALWRRGLELCRPDFERVIRLKPDGEAAVRARKFLDTLR